MDNLDFQLALVQQNSLLVFGLFLLCGVFGIILGSRIKVIPTITSFMILGLIIGPSGLELINKQILQESYLFIDVALGLILYKLGNMLHPKAMLKSKKMMMISLSETTLTFVFIFFSVKLLGYNSTIAVLISAIAVSSSPAILVHVAEELKAKGPITEKAKSLVALNNLFSFMLFSLVMPFVLSEEGHKFKNFVFLPLYKFVISAIIGIVMAWISVKINKMLKKEYHHYRFTLIIGAIMITLGLSSALHASTLLSPLILGISTRLFETSKHNLSKISLGEGGDLFLIVLFVMAGAKIDLSGLLEAGGAVVFLVIMRSLGKFAGIYVTMTKIGFNKKQCIATSLLLFPMAGMAIGLVASTSSLIPEIGEKIATIVFAMVAVFETVGPFAATRAFEMAEEIQTNIEGDQQPPKPQQAQSIQNTNRATDTN